MEVFLASFPLTLETLSISFLIQKRVLPTKHTFYLAPLKTNADQNGAAPQKLGLTKHMPERQIIWYKIKI